MSTKPPKQKEVWMVDFDPTQGSEIKKIRPAIVLSSDGVGKLPLRTVAPLTGWKDHFNRNPWHVLVKANKENGLTKDSAADALQIRAVATERFRRRMGKVSATITEEMKHAVALVLDIPIK